mgnify:CR=1 FL=1
MRKGNRAARRYLRNVKDWLPCSGKLKREIMARIKNVLDDYLAEHPDADFVELSHRFGLPKQIASSYVEEMDTEELLHNTKKDSWDCDLYRADCHYALGWDGDICNYPQRKTCSWIWCSRGNRSYRKSRIYGGKLT